MSKRIFFTGALTFALTLIPLHSQTSALEYDTRLNFLFNTPHSGLQLPISVPDRLKLRVEPEQATQPAKPPEPVKHIVEPGDNLSKIAAAHDISWLRIWNKNPELTNPDLIYPGQVFLIPDDSEALDDRPIPAAVVEVMAPRAATPAAPRGSSSGNTYSPGNCTWYAKSRRPDLPNNLGNANTWYARAAAQGLSVGTEPRAGAIGATTAGDLGHVVYVESVNGNTVTISEMNYRGLYSMNTRTVPASDFVYIY